MLLKAPLVDTFLIQSLIAAGEVFKPMIGKKYATKPATLGVAIDVPEIALYPPSIQAEVTLDPGAKTSTNTP